LERPSSPRWGTTGWRWSRSCPTVGRTTPSRGAIGTPPGRVGRYSPVGRSLDGCFRLKKRRFVVGLLVCQRDEPAMRFATPSVTWCGHRSTGSGCSVATSKIESESYFWRLGTGSISEVVGKMKAISAKVIFEGFPEAEREVHGGEFWEDGYFARTVGDEVTTQVIRRYIEYHDEEETRLNQLDLFDR